MRIPIVVTSLMALFGSSFAFAQAPDSLDFQGFLTNQIGDPIDSLGVGVTFKLYKDGSEVWSESQSVDVLGGVYSVFLGASTSLADIAFDQPVELGITLDGEGSEMTPRVRLVSAPYALSLRGLRVVPAVNGSLNSGPNLIGGGSRNYVGPGVVGATIGGGGGWHAGGIAVPDSVTGEWGTVSGGILNRADRLASVGGGVGCRAVGEYSVVGGGFSNVALWTYATVSGGSNNSASNDGTSIGGGRDNVASGYQSTVAGGGENESSGYASVVGGGFYNSAGDDSTTVAGGAHNTASANGAAIGGGTSNNASGDLSVVAGGILNQATSGASTVGGGDRNSAGAIWATVSGGGQNTVVGEGGTVCGGTQNISDANGAVGGGQTNKATGFGATVPGGLLNAARKHTSLAAGWQARANHNGTFVWQDSTGAYQDTLASTASNQFLARASGGFFFYTGAAPDLVPGASLPSGSGTWSVLSSRASKTDFAEIDRQNYLDRVASLELKTWSYKTEKGVAHVGPMAEDFYAAFGLGPDHKSISTVDADGVALAAIQALYELVKEQKAEIERMREAMRNAGME